MISKGSPTARPCAPLVACLLLMLQALPMAGMARAHDPSPYGGVFRSRNMGDAWLNADIGLFLNATRTPLETTDKIGSRTSPLG